TGRRKWCNRTGSAGRKITRLIPAEVLNRRKILPHDIVRILRIWSTRRGGWLAADRRRIVKHLLSRDRLIQIRNGRGAPIARSDKRFRSIRKQHVGRGVATLKPASRAEHFTGRLRFV